MKLKILLKLAEKFLGAGEKEAPSADMYLSDRILAMAILFLAGGTVALLSLFFMWSLPLLVCGIIALIGGILAFLCWKNQKVQMLSAEEFEYTTFLGATHRYKFSEIKMLRKNKDSMTLFVGNGKVHIESNAILSERFINAINAALKNLHDN